MCDRAVSCRQCESVKCKKHAAAQQPERPTHSGLFVRPAEASRGYHVNKIHVSCIKKPYTHSLRRHNTDGHVSYHALMHVYKKYIIYEILTYTTPILLPLCTVHPSCGVQFIYIYEIIKKKNRLQYMVGTGMRII